MRFDDALIHLGGFGRYQVFQFALLCLPGVVFALQILVSIFTVAIPAHRCALNENDTTYIPSPQVLESWNVSGDKTKSLFASVCIEAMPPPSVLNDSSAGNFKSDSNNKNASEKCDRWVYDREIYTTSAVAEFDLVCDRANLVVLPTVFTFVGFGIGTFTFGQLSDRFGRKTILFFTSIICGVVSLGSAWSPDIITYTVLKFISAAIAGGLLPAAFVLTVENVPESKRIVVGVAVQIIFGAGFTIIVGMAYFIRRWRELQIGISLFSFLVIPLWKILDESCRWLIIQGDKQQAKKVMIRIARMNGIKHPEQVVEELDVEEKYHEHSANIFDVLKSPILLRRSLILWINWFAVTFLYYGISMMADNLGFDVYLTSFLLAFIEIPVDVVCILTLTKAGRITMHCAVLILGGASCFSTLLVFLYGGKGLTWLVTTLSVIGKAAASAGFAYLYLITGEVFPTVVRNVSMGSGNMVSRLAGVVTPLIQLGGRMLGGNYENSLLLILTGCVSICSGLLILAVPETSGRALPETIEEGEEFGRGSTLCSRRRSDDLAMDDLDEMPPDHAESRA